MLPDVLWYLKLLTSESVSVKHKMPEVRYLNGTVLYTDNQ